MANLNQNEICAVLCLKRQYQQHDEKIFVCQRDQEHDIHPMTINKYDITLRRHLEFKIQISTLDSLFLPSFHVTLLVNYVRLNCRIKFYLKTNNAFKMLPFLGNQTCSREKKRELIALSTVVTVESELVCGW